MKKFATVCTGIGSPDLAAQSLGWEHVFMSEVDPHASAVLAHRFPQVPNLGDMTKIDGAKYRGSIDLICGGTPCQGFSIVGKRGGLDDPRSGLAIKFVELLAEVRPTWFVWENVPGVFSSTNGRDFASFLGCLTGRSISVPSRGWSNSGILEGIPSAYSVAWRTLDAQYFGVPQRRRRVFLIGHLGDWRPPAAVLFERESLSWNRPPSRKAKQADHAGSAGSTAIPIHDKATRYQGGGDTRNGDGSGNGLGIGKMGDPSPTLTAGDRHAVFTQNSVIAFSSKDYGADATIELSPTLRSGEFDKSWANGGAPPAIAFMANDSGNDAALDIAPTLRVGTGGNYPAIAFRHIVRRLTPRECERLQGLPDDWTQVGYRGKPIPDGPRYKMCGNSIAFPVIKWILSRIDSAI